MRKPLKLAFWKTNRERFTHPFDHDRRLEPNVYGRNVMLKLLFSLVNMTLFSFNYYRNNRAHIKTRILCSQEKDMNVTTSKRFKMREVSKQSVMTNNRRNSFKQKEFQVLSYLQT
jgi:hypothetical protein